MVELSLGLIDRLIALAKERASNKDKRLALAKATYADLTAIHENYIAVLTSIHDDVVRGNSKGVVKQIGAERTTLEALRRATATIAQTFASNDKLHAAKPFFGSVDQYFAEAQTLFQGSVFSFLFEVAYGSADNRDSQRYHRDLVLRAVTDSLEMIRRNWILVNSEYAELIAKSL